jgi:Flp pilus assembly protein TadG
MMNRLRERLYRRECGQSTVELALVLPLILLLLIGMVEFAQIASGYLTIQHAAREGARVGVTGVGDAAIIERVRDSARVLAASRLTVSVGPVESLRKSGGSLTVRVAYRHTLMTPLVAQILGSEITLESELTMRVE